MTTHQYASLDGIRGIAAIVVAFFYHYDRHFAPSIFPFGNFSYWLYKHGWVMVYLFFVLSGFIFYEIYSEKIIKRTISIKQFFILRFSRIYPLHWLTLFIVVILQFTRKYLGYSFFICTNNGVLLFVQNLLLIQNGWLQTEHSFNIPVWSLSIEIMMYFAFYIVFLKSKTRRRSLFFCFLLIFLGLIIGFVELKFRLNIPFINGQVGRGLTGFFMGCITAELYNQCNNNTRIKNIVLCTCMIFIIGLTVLPILFTYHILFNWQTVYTFLYFPALIIIALNISLVSSLFSLKPLLYLGELSFSIYLLHFPLQIMLKTIDDFWQLEINYSNKLFFIGFSLFIIFIAHIVHFNFEKPVQKYIRKRLKLCIK